MTKAFTCASVLGLLKSGSFNIVGKADAMVDAHGYVNRYPVARMP